MDLDLPDLGALATPDETALQLVARCHAEPLPSGVFFLGPLRPGQLLEVAGPAGVGKTTLLLQAAATAVLPGELQGQPVGGLGEHALLLDLDQKFDVLRLMEMLHARLRPALDALSMPGDGEEAEALMRDCLSRFHLVRCSSSFELLAVLRTLDAFLMRLQAEGGCHLLLLDNVAAHHWLDAAVRAEAPSGSGALPSALTLQAVHTAAAAAVKQLAKQLRLAVVATKHAFRAAGPGTGEEAAPWQQREVMCKQWAEAVTQRVTLRHVSGGAGALPSLFAARTEAAGGAARLTSFCITDWGIVPRQHELAQRPSG